MNEEEMQLLFVPLTLVSGTTIEVGLQLLFKFQTTTTQAEKALSGMVQLSSGNYNTICTFFLAGVLEHAFEPLIQVSATDICPLLKKKLDEKLFLIQF